jgi:hypothetical protein
MVRISISYSSSATPSIIISPDISEVIKKMLVLLIRNSRTYEGKVQQLFSNTIRVEEGIGLPL